MSFNAEVEPVSRTQKQIEYLALGAGTLCFLIGWWHTGKGLEYMQILSSPYGSFVVSTFVLSVLLIAYWKAIEGVRFAIFWYFLFALVNFVCNLNSFYPNYRGNELLRQELAYHNASLVKLREDIDNRFAQPDLEKLKSDIEAGKKALQQQIVQRGFGPRADDALKKIEDSLGLQYGNIQRPLRDRTESEWQKLANAYGDIVDKKLEAHLKGKQYDEKHELINAIDSDQKNLGGRIVALLQSGDRITAPPPPAIIDQAVRLYQSICEKALGLATASQLQFSCDENYASTNKGFGSFSHTFTSIPATVTDGDTLTILAICFLIDFGCPLAIYFLVRRRPGSTKWRVGKDYRATAL